MRAKKTYMETSLDQNYLQDSLAYVDLHKDRLQSSFKQKLFEQLITYLDLQQREILYLVYQEKKSYQEIASIL